MFSKHNGLLDRSIRGALAAIIAISGGALVVLPHSAWGTGTMSSYVVILSDAVVDPGEVAAEHELLYGVDTSFIYRSALRGYSALMSEEAAALIATDIRVRSVGSDVPLDLAQQAIGFGLDRIYDPPTNNSRMSGLTIDSNDDARVDADIAIIDTGIDHTHPDLYVVGGTDCTRATTAGNCVDGFFGDDNSHGTHVAGIAAALDNGIGMVGVAPGARLWSVDVLNSSGGNSLSSLLAGIDWVSAKADIIDVANISLGCKLPCEEVNLAIKNSVGKGISYFVAAGNSASDASYDWPANSPDAITVSALADLDGKSGGLEGFPPCSSLVAEVDDALWSSSNWGAVVDIAAPGFCINSTIPGGGYMRESGTSMAAPHAAGAAALLASRPEYRGNPAQIRQALLDGGNFDWKDYYRDTVKEPLLEVTLFSPVTISNAPNELPDASFTKSCSGSSCTFTSTSTDSDGTIQLWSWALSDGTNLTGPTVTHAFQSAGKYVVVLTVTDDRGGTSSDSQGVTCRSHKGKLVCR